MPAAADAWAAYQRLLAWAEERGMGRRPAETTGQFSVRLGGHVPEAAPSVDLVTQVFERERYGGVQAGGDALARVRRALGSLLSR